jgi:predicted dehydrogenase
VVSLCFPAYPTARQTGRRGVAEAFALTVSKDKVKVAAIGCGYFGSLHAQKYAALDAAELVGVCDIDAKRAETCAEKNGTTPYTDIADLFDKVDAVTVAVPTTEHFEVARAFLENGVDVLIEKPICSTLDEADALIALAAEKDRILQVGHLERFSPIMEALSEEVVKPGYIESHRISQYRGRGTDTTVILDMMIHDIDHILHMVGSPIEQLDAVGVPVISPAEDIANARLRFASGCVATVTASRVSWKVQRTMRIFQRNAYIVADMADNKMVVTRRTGGEDGEPMTLGAEQREFEPVDLLMLQAGSFLDCVATRTPPVVSGADVRPVLEAALSITDQLREWHRRTK